VGNSALPGPGAVPDNTFALMDQLRARKMGQQASQLCLSKIAPSGQQGPLVNLTTLIGASHARAAFEAQKQSEQEEQKKATGSSSAGSSSERNGASTSKPDSTSTQQRPTVSVALQLKTHKVVNERDLLDTIRA
jgi:hypothetical protein